MLEVCVYYTESYYKTRSVCGRICPATPPLFTGRWGPNLTGRSGSGTVKTWQGLFPWQPKEWFLMAKSGLWLEIRLAVTSESMMSHVCARESQL